MNTVLIEVAVITTLVGSTTFYMAVQRWLRQRQAWQWWHQHQTNRLHAQAESIRDDLLQQTFAFRRFLENSLEAQPDTAQTEQWLKRFHTLYQSLEQLSDRLSPPFMGDSLPLALQFMVQTWQQSHPGLTVQCNVPSDWPDQATTKNPIILSIFTGLIESLFLENGGPCQLKITLERQDKLCTLAFEQVQGQAAAVHTAEIKHLKEIFRSLTAGRLEVVAQASGLKGTLYWQDRS